MFKYRNKLVVALILLLVIIITPNISKADDEETISANEEEIAIDEEFKFFTIEELIFNKIPALNVNVFDNTDVKADSITMNIRNSIATWYVAFRNVATVCLGFTIIYIGLKLAMTTVASDKANYKKMLINWITAVLIVYFIHIVMILVLNINDSLLKLLYSNSLSTEEIYQTIRTRINDLKLVSWLPAIIIYCVLFIYSLMFLWVYIKRYFTVLILIIIAPLVGVKYAIDSAGKGQKSKILSTWLYEFTMNVLLQSLHALIFTVLIGISVDLATTSVLGFIIALVFLNFILKADKIFMNIFRFNRSKMVGDIAKPLTNPKEEFATALFVGGAAWDFAGSIKDTTLYGGKQVGRLGKKLYKTVVNKDTRDNIKDEKNKFLDKVDNNLNKAYKAVTGKDSHYLSIAVMSRRKDSTGLAAKKQLRKAKNNIKTKFTAPFKFIKSAGGGVLKVGIGVPLTVVNPGVGVGLMLDGTEDFIKMGTQRDKKGHKYTGVEGVAQFATLGAYGTAKEMKKDKDKMGKTVGYFNEAIIKENEIEEEFESRFEKTSREAIDRYKKEVKYFITYGNKENINMILRQKMAYRGVLEINDGNIEDVIEKMADDMFEELKIDDQYSKEKAYKIKKAMIEKTKEAFNQSKIDVQAEEFGSLEIANKFSEAIKEEGISTEVDVENIQDITSKFVDEQTSFDEANLDSSVEKIASEVMSELHMEDRASKEEISRIVETAKQGARNIFKDKAKNNPNFRRLSQIDISRSVHRGIRDVIGEKNIRAKFGFGNVTSKIEELHDINIQAQDDVKTKVVRENKFIDSLGRKE